MNNSATSSNPAFSEKVWARTGASTEIGNHATIDGAVNKTLILLVFVVLSSYASWVLAAQSQDFSWYFPTLIGVIIAQLVLTVMIIRKPELSKNYSIIYALLEGVVLGALSLLFERLYPGIVVHAVLGTTGVIAGMMILYKTRIIKVTENFKLMVFSATAGIAFLYLASFIARLFGTDIPFIHEGSTIGIIFSVFVIGAAAFNLAIDFDFIEKCEENRAPQYMEWYGVFGLLVTIIWIYIEMLRLLAKTRSKN